MRSKGTVKQLRVNGEKLGSKFTGTSAKKPWPSITKQYAWQEMSTSLQSLQRMLETVVSYSPLLTSCSTPPPVLPSLQQQSVWSFYSALTTNYAKSEPALQLE